MSGKLNNGLIMLKREGPIGVLTLCNPPLNLLSNAMKDELKNQLSLLKADESLRVLIVTGSGDRAFCAGADLKEFPDRIKLNTAGEVWDKGHSSFDLCCNLPQMMIAALNGPALGGGYELALACDIIFAADTATVGLPEVKRGIMPGNGGVEALYHRVGYAAALELLVTGRIFKAEDAASLGLVDHLVPEDNVVTGALKLAQEISCQPGLAVRGIKETLVHYHTFSREQARAVGRQLFRSLHQTKDCKEGIQAFFEKREPKFCHC